MAAPIGGLVRCVCSTYTLGFKCIQYRLGKVAAFQELGRRCQSSDQSSKHNRGTPLVGLTPDGSTVLCWHPKPKFPYEHTQPLPRHQPELAKNNSELKVEHLVSEKYRFRPIGPDISELSSMFYTTKHRWYPKPGKKYKKRYPPKDRDGL